MADRYWVGGTGSWSSTNTANWSDTSGGAGGFSVPTAADNVIFDAGSDSGGIFTVTMANTPRVCNDITISGLDFTMTLAGTSIGLTVSGSLSFPATNFTRTYTGTTTFNATTTGKTITTNGVAFGGAVTLDGVGGAWTLGSAFSCGTNTLTLTNGTFDTSVSNYSVTVGTFSSSNSNTRTINLNGSTLLLSISWFVSTSTNATLNAGTSSIQLSLAAASFSGGGLTYYNVSFTSTSTGTIVITGANTFNNLTFSTVGVAGLINISISANQTINGTLTVTGVAGNRRMFVRSATIGTSRTLTCAAIAAMTDVDFRDITIAGAHGTLSGTRLGDCNGNSNITFDAGVDKYWNLAAGGNWSATAWALSSGGGVAAANFPLAQDTVIIENTGLNTSATVTINQDYAIGTLDTSTRTNAMTLASSNNNPIFYGNFTYGSGVTPTGTATYTFTNRSTKTLNSGGKTFPQNVTINAPGGGIQLITNNLTVDTADTTTLTSGTLDLNNLVLTTGLFSSSNSNTRTIAFGTGNISCSGTGAVWDSTPGTGLTTTGTQVVNVTSVGSTAISLGMGALSEANSISFNFTGGTYSLGFSQGVFRDLNFTGYAGALSLAGTIYGNLTLSTGLSITAFGSTTTFAATSGTKTITTNGKTLDFPVIFNGVGGTWQLQDAMTVGATRTTTLTNGTVDLFNNTLTTGIFASTNSNTRSIAFGSTGGITLTTTTLGSNVLSMATATNFTFTGTSNISAAMSVTRTFNFGGTAGATTSNRLNINLTSGASVPTFATNSSFRQINFTGSTCNPGSVNISCHGFTLASGGTYTSTDFTIIGTGTLTSNGKVIDTLTVNESGITTTLQDALTTLTGSFSATCTLNQGTLDLNGFTLTTSILSSSTSNTRAIAFGTTGSIVLAASAGQTNLSMATATNFTFTGTSNISAAMSVTRTFNFGGGSGATASNRPNINLTSGASVPTFTGSFRQINFTGSTSNPGSQTISCHGFTLASGGTYTSTDFTTVGTGTLTYTGKTIDILNINTAGITTTLADAGINASLTLTNGTLDLAGFTLTNTSASTATGTKDLTFNGGTLALSGSGATVWNNAAPTGFTTTAGTGTGTISMTSASAKTFVGGGSTYNCTLNQGGAGTLTITGANTFNDITNTNATASQITFPASTTTTVNAFTLSGTSGNLVSIRSSTPATRFTLSKSSGTVSVSFLDIQDSNATGGATWSASTGNGNVDSGNNLGWIFGSFYAVSVSETATGEDAITLVLVRVGEISETTTGADTTASQLDAVGAVSETATGADQLTNIASLQLFLAETATGADTAATTLTRVGEVSETATGADTTATQLDAVGAVSETATGADTTASQLDAVGAVSETATGVDTTASQLTTSGAISETATGADTTASQLDTSGAVSETATGADTTASQLNTSGAVSETATGADTTASQLSTAGAISETATGAEADTVTLTSVGFVDETATGADTTASQLDAFGGVDEAATAADNLATQLDGVANIDEIVTGVDSPLGNIITTLQIAEGATIVDESLARLLWELINDNQLPGWQLIQNPQGTGWTVINTNTGTSWTPIGTA